MPNNPPRKELRLTSSQRNAIAAAATAESNPQPPLKPVTASQPEATKPMTVAEVRPITRKLHSQKTIVCHGHHELGSVQYHHGDELPPGSLGQRASRLLARQETGV